MRCIYCHDLVTEHWTEMRHGERAHTGCALAVWARQREIVNKGREVATRELSDKDAQRMIRNWEEEL